MNLKRQTTSLINNIKQLLISNNLKLKIAESFTGGYISSLFTSIEGASQYLTEGLITYSPESKINRLNIDKSTIDNYKTVSLNCILAMLNGLKNTDNCDIALASTGNASNSIEQNTTKGECFIGIKTKTQTLICRYKLSGKRTKIISQAATIALKMLKNTLK